jgi:hypothetical protein
VAYPPPAGYPPGAYPGYPPGAYPAYPPPYPVVQPEETAEAAVPAIAPFRPVRFRAGFGMGAFSPSDVNSYLATKVPSGAYTVQGTSDMVLLLSADLSIAYYPTRFFGIRPTATYLFSPKIIAMDNGDSGQGFWLHSLAPGLSLDFAFDEGKLARFFFNPGIAYHLAWFEGYGASGLGLSLAVGAELSFGAARAKGISLALVARSAKLGINSRPDTYSSVAMNNLDFSSLLFCIGFQTGM